VRLLLAAALSLQHAQATAIVDRDEVELGQQVVLTITVEISSGNQPVSIENPSITGLEVQGTIDQTDVAVRSGTLTRVAVREIRLIATEVGTATIGSARIESGTSVVVTNPIDITVAAAPTSPADALSTHVRALISGRSPNGLSGNEVLVEIITSADTILLGEQLELIVLAWFPRRIRSRLRNPPTLQPPQFQAAWIYPQSSPGSVALSRRIAGEWYDVYVHHQVVFPLTPGAFEIGPATVSYNLPLTYSFLSREVLHEPQSTSATVEVLPQPSEHRAVGFDGASAARLEFTVQAEPTTLGLGDAGSVVATLAGRGNVALWPEPVIRWPDGIRVYPQEVEIEIDSRDDGIWGTKTFRYLIVPDSYGDHLIAAPTYQYFDLEELDYVTLTSPALELVTEASSQPFTQVPLRDLPRLMEDAGGVTADRLLHGWSPFTWLALVTLLPLIVVAARISSRLRLRAVPRERHDVGAMDRLEQRFKTAVDALVVDPQRFDGPGLTAALRAAGVEQPIAAHAARVRERLWQARYGPEGEMDPNELSAELAEVIRALKTWEVTHEGAKALGVTVLFALVVSAIPLSAQSAERLYQTGAPRAAADSFRARAEAYPLSAAHWYNLGSALYSSGSEVPARAAWLRAARLKPRSRTVASAMERLAPVDGTTRRMIWVSPVTPGETYVAALLLWTMAWLFVALRSRARLVVPLMALAVLAAAYGLYVSRRYNRPTALIADDDTPLRVAPYGSAQDVSVLGQGSAVLISRTEGSWVLVKRPGGTGWVRQREIVRI
jgi:hypothetical protein